MPKKESLTKAQLLSEIAGKTDLTKAQVGEVFAALAAVVAGEMKGGRPVVVPGIVKVTVVHKPATPARTMANPFAPGTTLQVKAKPAGKKVKVRPVKALKDMA